MKVGQEYGTCGSDGGTYQALPRNGGPPVTAVSVHYTHDDVHRQANTWPLRVQCTVHTYKHINAA